MAYVVTEPCVNCRYTEEWAWVTKQFQELKGA
jgi:hypothetical protein